MNIQSYFSDIREHIINELRLAESSIYIAVAWFTDKELFDILCNKATMGLKVELIAIKDEINSFGSIDFTDLLKNGGKVWLVEDQKTMHNKFCVIDKHIVLNGSYNWTYKASDNHENIMIITNHNETTENYLEQFKQIKIQYFGTEKEAYHKLSLRLAALKNLIQLNDKDDILKQGEKIKSLSLFVYLDQYNKIQSILEQCKSNNFENAIRLIDELIVEADNFIPEEEVAANTFENIFAAIEADSIIGVEFFLRQEIDINIQDEYGNSLLHTPCFKEQFELVKYLVHKNINLNINNIYGQYPIDLLKPIYSNNESIFELLYENGAKLNPQSDTFFRYLSYLLNKSMDKAIFFIDSFEDINLFISDIYFEKIFLDAMYANNYKLARCLIKNGFDVNAEMSNGQKLIPSFDFKSENDLQINTQCVRFLIGVGADWKSYFGSEVFLKIFYRDIEGIKESESFTCVNSLGQTPLYYLCLISYDCVKLEQTFVRPAIKFLSKSCYSFITPDNDGITLIENHRCKRWMHFITLNIFENTLHLTNQDRNKQYLINRYDEYSRSMSILFEKLYIDTVFIDDLCIEKNENFEINGYPTYSVIWDIDGVDYTFKENLLSMALCLNDLNAAKLLIFRGVDVNSDINTNRDLFDDQNLFDDYEGYYISCLEYVRRKGFKEIEFLLIERGAVNSEYDMFVKHKEQQKIIAELAKESKKRENELEIERQKIEMQKIDDRKKKEDLEYKNSNFLRKMVIDYNKKKRK